LHTPWPPESSWAYMDMRQHGQGIEACMFGDGCLEKHNIYIYHIYIYQSPQVNVYFSTHPVFFRRLSNLGIGTLTNELRLTWTQFFGKRKPQRWQWQSMVISNGYMAIMAIIAHTYLYWYIYIIVDGLLIIIVNIL